MQDTPKRPAAVDDDLYVREGGNELLKTEVQEGIDSGPGRPLLAVCRDLKEEIRKGLDSADRGELIPADEVFDRLESKYRAVAGKRRRSN